MKEKIKVDLTYVSSNEIKEATANYLENEHLIKKDLQVKSVENGIILPHQPTYGAKGLPNLGLGGILDSNYNFVKESFYDGGWAKQGGYYNFSKENIDNIDIEVIYIGSFIKHFGHFLIDQVTRLWLLVNKEEIRNKKIAYIGSEKLSGNFLEFLNLLAIDNDKLIYIDKPTQFRKIYIPEQAAQPGEWYTEEIKKIFVEIAKTAMEKNKKIETIKNIYFTRTNFAVAKQKEVGENIYEEIFKRNDYKILIPENLSLSEMIYYINTADKIVCINGTIPLNIIFALKPVNLIVLNKTEKFHRNLMYFLDIVGNNVTYIDVYSEKHKGTNIGIGPFLIEYTNQMKKFCEDNNLAVPNEIFKYERENKKKYLYIMTRRKVRNIFHPIKQKIKYLVKKNR